MRLLGYIIVIIFMANAAAGDVVFTQDGMIINGKITDKIEDKIVIINIYGTFTIENKKIKEVYETKSFSEDIMILEEKGKVLNKEEVEKNYKFGVREIEKQRKKEPAFLVCSLIPLYYIPTGKYRNIFTWGAGLSANANLNLKDILYNSKSYYYPDLSADYNFLVFQQDEIHLNGISIAAGPVWTIPVTFDIETYFSLTPGMGVYDVADSDYDTRFLKFCMNVEFGFVYSFGRVIVRPLIRYTYINDVEAPLNCVAFSLGIGYRFPPGPKN